MHFRAATGQVHADRQDKETSNEQGLQKMARANDRKKELHQLIDTVSVDTVTDTDLQVLPIGRKVFTITRDSAEDYQWKNAGFNMYVESDTLLPDQSCDIIVEPFICGQFEFPEDSVLVSGVYHISVTGDELLKPVTLEIQHCVDLEREDQCKSIQFVVAERPLKPDAPYHFEPPINGGTFRLSSQYGRIKRKEFSYFAITYNESDNTSDHDSTSGGSDSPDTDEEDTNEDNNETISSNNTVNDGSSSTLHVTGACIILENHDMDGRRSDTCSLQATGTPQQLHHDQPSCSPLPQPLQEPLDQQESHQSSSDIRYIAQRVYIQESEKNAINTWIFKFIVSQDLELIKQYIRSIHGLSVEEKDFEIFKYINDKLVLDLPSVTQNGWTISPEKKENIITKESVNEHRNITTYPRAATCEATIQGINVTERLSALVKVTGAEENLSFNIIRPVPPKVMHSIPSSRSIGSSPSEVSLNRDLSKKLAQQLSLVLQEHNADLNDFLEKSTLTAIANKMYSAGIITKALKDDPTYNKMENQFTRQLNFSDEKEEFESLCKTFLEALSSQGRALERVAKKIKNRWMTTCREELDIDLNL